MLGSTHRPVWAALKLTPCHQLFVFHLSIYFMFLQEGFKHQRHYPRMDPQQIQTLACNAENGKSGGAVGQILLPPGSVFEQVMDASLLRAGGLHLNWSWAATVAEHVLCIVPVKSGITCGCSSSQTAASDAFWPTEPEKPLSLSDGGFPKL